jgi:tetratricopeptide (TPR) repeat protein
MAALLCAALLIVVACGEAEPPADPHVEVPEPDLTKMEPQVEKRLKETRAAVLANPQSAIAWGRFGMVSHAHDLFDEATVAYRQAWRLDPADKRWPYFLGDVLSIVGTDLEAAEQALRRAMELYPDYAPAHMRLGNVLVVRDQGAAAAIELERALELAADLEPAKVALAQVRLSEGDLEASAALLEEILQHSPRHGQALATLGQVYGRQGRRDEAREIAERARDPASYNLYSDPLMNEVVNEGVSAVLLWERAKSFLENGNYQQAALGLRQVVALRPENPEVHLQLAVAYGGLGELELAGRHLERTVELDPEQADARTRLASFYLEQRSPASAVPHFEKALELSPDRADLRWLLGRAQLLAGAPRRALASFEAAAAAAGEAPVWAHNEWGSALAQTGRPEDALDRFNTTLAADPGNPQALFYSGLVLEGLGRVQEAVDHYCRSLEGGPNRPTEERLRTLGRSCG